MRTHIKKKNLTQEINEKTVIRRHENDFQIFIRRRIESLGGAITLRTHFFLI